MTIVGVVGEIRRDGRGAPLWPQVYLPAAQTDLHPVRLASLAVRANSDPYGLVSGIQRAVWSVDQVADRLHDSGNRVVVYRRRRHSLSEQRRRSRQAVFRPAEHQCRGLDVRPVVNDRIEMLHLTDQSAP